MKKIVLIVVGLFLIGGSVSLLQAQGYTPGSIADFGQDIQVPVKSGLASQTKDDTPGPYGHGYSIDNTFDGKKDPTFKDETLPIYASPYTGTVFPVTLEYFFENASEIDYFIYYPKSGNGNGCFWSFEVWAKSEGKTSYEKIGTYDFKGLRQVMRVDFPTRLVNPTAIKFVINYANTGFVSFCEMEFYKTNPGNTIPDVFGDNICSTLKSGTTLAQIEAITNSFYKNLAMALYNNQYPKEFRVQTYKPYSDPTVQATINKTSTYGQYDDPTGIYAEEGEEFVVFVGNTNGQTVSLRQMNLDKETEETDGFGDIANYPLKEGVNLFKTTKKGLFYFIHIQNNPTTATPIDVNIASGKVNGYFDKKRHTNSDWENLLANATSKYMDVIGESAHIIFPVQSYKSYCPKKGQELIQAYDSIVHLEQEFMGLYKYPERMYKNRAMFTVTYSGYMYATGNHTAYHVSTMPGVCDPAKVTTTDIWGPAHEIGHTHQTRPGLRWASCAEVTNNIYSLYVQTKYGNQSRMQSQATSNGRKNHYENSFNTILVPDTANFNTVGGEFNRLIPFWQLYLYSKYVKNYPDFYLDLHEEVRKRSNLNVATQSGQISLDFTKLCSELLKEDLSDFFKKWGFHKLLTNRHIGDYGSHYVTVTQNMVTEAVTYTSQWTKPTYKIEYITDANIDIYADKKPLERGTASKTGNSYVFSNWKNAVAYEIYDGQGKLRYISPHQEFTTIAAGSITGTVKARVTGFDGTYMEVTFEADPYESALPVASTENNPVWYYIENGHNMNTNGVITDNDGRFCSLVTVNGTSEEQKNNTKYISIDLLKATSAGRDYQVWRLEDAGNDSYYLVNKATNQKMAYGVEMDGQRTDRYYSSGNNPTTAAFRMAAIAGSPFVALLNTAVGSDPTVSARHLSGNNSGNGWSVFDNASNAALAIAQEFRLTRNPRTWRFVPEEEMNDAYPPFSEGNTEKWVYISNVTNEKCIEIAANGTVSLSTKADRGTSRSDQQLFKLVQAGTNSGLVNIINRATGKYLYYSGNAVISSDQVPSGFALRHLFKPGESLQFNIRSARTGTLLNGTGETLEMKSFSTANANYGTSTAWKFAPESGGTAIHSPETDNIHVFVLDRKIYVDGTDLPASIYGISGQRIHSNNFLAAGVYIVVVAGKVFKVIVK